MTFQKIVFIIVAKLIIVQGKIRPGDEADCKDIVCDNGDHQDRELNFGPEMNTKDLLLDFCYNHSPQCRLNAIPRFSKILDDSKTNPQNVLRVLQWNILAQALGQYNNNFVRCPPAALEWNYRRCVLLDEMLSYKPDVMCFQEVDHFDFFYRALATQSYSGVFEPKSRSLTIEIAGNNGPDGCAIFYNNNKYEISEKFKHDYYKLGNNCRQVALLVVLRDKSSGVQFCFVTTHLKSQKGIEESVLRNAQGEDLMNFVSQHCKEVPTIITGDFNAASCERVYRTMRNYHGFELNSAYNVSNKEPNYTSWKIREKKGCKKDCKDTKDYIFYTPKHFTVGSIVAMPRDKDIGEDRTPSMSYPSDHFSLIADFFVNKT